MIFIDSLEKRQKRGRMQSIVCNSASFFYYKVQYSLGETPVAFLKAALKYASEE